jgi:hypothetical protein
MGPSLPLACFIFEGKGSNFKGSLVLLGDPWWHLLAVSTVGFSRSPYRRKQGWARTVKNYFMIYIISKVC